MAHFIPFPDKFHLVDEFMQTHHPIESSDCLLSNECRLALYSLRQQALHGENRTTAPSRWNIMERAKWDAWSSLGRMSQLEAMVFYVQLVEKEVDSDWLSKVSPPPQTPQDITVTAEPHPSEEQETTCADRVEGRARPSTEDEMWACLQEAWRNMDQHSQALRERDHKLSELREQLATERQTADLLRQQNGMLQGQLQAALHQRDADLRARLVPKRRPVAAAVGKPPEPATSPSTPPAAGPSSYANGHTQPLLKERLHKPQAADSDPRRLSEPRIVNYYYSDTPQKGWWGWLRPW